MFIDFFEFKKIMKALSLKQPFAELIVSGKKTIELRKWNTNFRGEFLIHASKVPDKKAMQRFGFTNLPTGGIVGKSVLTEVKHYQNSQSFWLDKDKHLASLEWGTYGFVLQDAARLPYIAAKGKLGFWELDEERIK